MDNSAFIKIGNTRIKLSNIKNYGISMEQSTEKIRTMEVEEVTVYTGEYRRKIWFTDYLEKWTAKPNWHSDDDYPNVSIDYDSRPPSSLDAYLHIDDNTEWEKYIDMKALKEEYLKVKEIAVEQGKQKKRRNKEKNWLTAPFKNKDLGRIHEELSGQEVVVPIPESPTPTLDSLLRRDKFDFLRTIGKLYYNGSILRCTGSPMYGEKVEGTSTMSCSHFRLCDKEAVLIESGELKKVVHCEKRDVLQEKVQQKVKNTRYLYISTYQNDNHKFSENNYNIDELLKKLDENLSI